MSRVQLALNVADVDAAVALYSNAVQDATRRLADAGLGAPLQRAARRLPPRRVSRLDAHPHSKGAGR